MSTQMLPLPNGGGSPPYNDQDAALRAEIADQYAPVGPTQAAFAMVASGAYLSTPNDASYAAGLSAFEIAVKYTANDWVGAQQVIVNASGTQKIFQLALNSDGTVAVLLSVDGTNWLSLYSAISSTVVDDWSNGSPYWIKVTWSAADGEVVGYWQEAGDSDEVPTDGWTTGSAIAATESALSSSANAILTLGLNGSSMAGRLHRAVVRNDIGGTKIADVRALSVPYVAISGKRWSSTGATGVALTAGKG